MEMFEKMELELIRFGAADVIATSGDPDGSYENGGEEIGEPMD